MNDLLIDPLLYMGLALIVLLPATILVLGELRSRTARSGSRLHSTVSYTRSWVVPVLAVWAVLVVIVGLTRSLVPIRFLETLLIAVSVSAGLRLFRALFVERNADGSAPVWRERVPGLILAAPRLLLVGISVYLVALIWGVDVSQGFAALGVGSLVIALALQDTLSGLVSGFLLMADRPFQPGDWIEADGVTGRVVDIRWRTVRVRTRQNTLIVVPNAVLAGQVIVNRSAPDPLHRIDVDFDVAFSNSPTAAREMLLRAAMQTRGIRTDPAPEVAVTRVDDPLMGYRVQAWIDSYDDEPRVLSELRDRVWYQSQRDDVPLPSPAYDLFHWDGEKSAAPSPTASLEIGEGLAAARVIRTLPKEHLDQLAAKTQKLTYAKGELILAPGTVFPDLFVLGSGAAELIVVDEDGSDRVFDDLTSGDLFGLIPLTDLELNTGVRTITDCVLYRAARTEVFDLLTTRGEIAEELRHLANMRTRRAVRVIEPTDLDAWLEQASPAELESTPNGGPAAAGAPTPNGPATEPEESQKTGDTVIDLRDEPPSTDTDTDTDKSTNGPL